MTFINFVSSTRSHCSCICNFFLFPVCIIRGTSVRLEGSFVNFAISSSVGRISSRTSSNSSIFSMPIHDFVAVFSRCVVSSIRNAISHVISLAATLNCTVRSLFSNSSIQTLYFVSTVSILSTIFFARTTTFHTFSSMGPSSSTYMSESFEHNSATIFLMLASSFFRCVAVAMAFRYIFSMSSHSCLSTTFSALTICSLSLNSLVICACKVFNVSDGSTTKSSYATPSCNPSGVAGLHMLINVTSMSLCQFPSLSMTMLGVVDGVATCGAWLINVFSSVSCVSIIFLRTSYTVVITVSGSVIVP